MKILIPFFAVFLTMNSAAQLILEEVIVTAQKRDVALPGVVLTRMGDYLLLEVRVSNDTRDEAGRKDEIYKTLRRVISSAEKSKSIELSIVENGFVVPMNQENYKVELEGGARPDTSATRVHIKTRIPPKATSPKGLVDELRSFIGSVKVVGRTEIKALGSVSISVVSPNQYRAQILKMFAADVNAVTSELGDEYTVLVEGIDQQVEYARIGTLQVALFIPYSYTVLPKTLNSLMIAPEY